MNSWRGAGAIELRMLFGARRRQFAIKEAIAHAKKVKGIVLILKRVLKKLTNWQTAR
jgi:hypothetical protein